MSKKVDRHRVNVSFEVETYAVLENLAAIHNTSIPEVIRQYTVQGINGTLTQNNIDFLTPIIRSQLKSILDVKVERLAAMIAKTCIQAGAAAYLSAEAINSFVPPQRQQNFIDAYDAARKKAVIYLKKGTDITDIASEYYEQTEQKE